MRQRLILALFCVLTLPIISHSQAVRWDIAYVLTTNQSAPQPGGMYPVLAVPNATISICSGNPCTLATTYTSATSGVTCPPTAQLTRGTSTACYSTSDQNGGAGAWLLPGSYQYTVTTPYGTYGPYPFGVDAAGLYLALVGGNLTGPLKSTSTINGVWAVNCAGVEDTAQFNSVAALAGAAASASNIQVITVSGNCVVGGQVTAPAYVHWLGAAGGSITVPTQTGSCHYTFLATNADNVAWDYLNFTVTTSPGGDNACYNVIQWIDSGGDSTAHQHVYIRNNTISNSVWGVYVQYAHGTGSLSDVDISGNTISSPTVYTNGDGIHVDGAVTNITVANNRISNRNDAGIGLTTDGSYILSGFKVSNNVLLNDRVGLDNSGAINGEWSGNYVSATTACASCQNPAFRQIYFTGYPTGIQTHDNYFNSGNNSGTTSTVKIDPANSPEASWPNLSSTFENNIIDGPNAPLYVRGNGITIDGNTFNTGGQFTLDYDGTNSVATANIAIGANKWMANGSIVMGGGCALYSNVNLQPQTALGTLTYTNLACIGQQTVNFPGTLSLGSNFLQATANNYLTFKSGTSTPSFGAAFQDNSGNNLLIINNDGSGINVPDGPINTGFYFKMGGGANGGLRNSSGATVVPGTASGYHGSSSVYVQMSDGSGTSGNCPKFGADGGLTDSGFSCGGGGGGVTLPNATDTNDTIQVNGSGTPALLTPATSGTWEAVQHGGADNTGSVDASSILQTKLNALCASSTPARVHLAAGTYKINSGIKISATSTTCKNLVIEGDGPNTILQTNCSGTPGTTVYGIWYDNTTNSGEHFNGPIIRHLQIQNTGTTACAVGLQLTQTAGFIVDDVLITGFSGQTYATGTIATSGSAVTGSGTTFTAAMVHGFIEVTSGTTTTRAEVCGYTSATSLTLCSSAFPTGNLSGASYALAFGGDGIAIDPGFSYTQYGSINNAYLPGNLIGIHAWGTSNAASGTSRITISGDRNYISPNPSTRITDSVAVFLGKKSDTFTISAPANNQATCFVVESGHAWRISGKCEDNSTYAPVTTCNGGVATQNCTQAAEVSSDANGNGWGGEFNIYAYLVGTVYRFDNSAGAFNVQIQGDQTLSGQYTTHYDWYGTTGCPANASGIPAIVTAYDCNHQLVTQTVN